MLHPTARTELLPDTRRARTHRLADRLGVEPEVVQEACTPNGVELLLAALERHAAAKAP